MEEATIIGPLVIIGGHEDKFEHAKILRRLTELARNHRSDGAMAIVTTASREGTLSFDTYHRAFSQFGLGAFPLRIDTRHEAELPQIRQALDDAAGVFFTGGDQLRITSVLGGTTFHRTLRSLWQQGLVVAGTSAGASMMSRTMIVAGDAEESPARNTVKMSPGMGLWAEAVIDQHFSQRGRVGRLLSAVAQNPEMLGIGIDENTALVVELDDQRCRVVGAGTVLVIDGQHTQLNNASEIRPDQALALSHVHVHVLPEGYGIELETRSPYHVGESDDDN